MGERESLVDDRYLTVTEAATALHLSKSLLYREIHQGRLHCHRFGARCYRIAVSDLRRYQESNAIAYPGASANTHNKQRAVSRPSVLRHVCWKRSPAEQT